MESDRCSELSAWAQVFKSRSSFFTLWDKFVANGNVFVSDLTETGLSCIKLLRDLQVFPLRNWSRVF